jgi:RNA polymerase sigma-70 factor (ECF subfamily)
MARNRAIDVVRSRSASQRREDDDHRLDAPVPSDVVDAVVRRESARAVRGALDLLTPDQREAILLAYFGGHTYREVAERLGIPEGTAKSRLRIGLRRLGELLTAQGVTL